MLDPAEALLLDGGHEFPVLDEAGGGVGVKRVQTEDVGHPEKLPNPFDSKLQAATDDPRLARAILHCRCDLSTT